VQLFTVRFGVLTAVVMESSIFGDIMSCSQFKAKLPASCCDPEDGGGMFLWKFD
jgi:hypothetical protein